MGWWDEGVYCLYHHIPSRLLDPSPWSIQISLSLMVCMIDTIDYSVYRLVLYRLSSESGLAGASSTHCHPSNYQQKMQLPGSLTDWSSLDLRVAVHRAACPLPPISYLVPSSANNGINWCDCLPSYVNTQLLELATSQLVHLLHH